MNQISQAKALTGIRVVDLSRVLAGPYCAQLLADMGADVIKVEGPGGDENRKWPPLLSDSSTNFSSVNRGKRSIALDLKSKAAQKVMFRLVKWADVLVHNFLPATATKLNISYERMREINPRLIFCSISGYGEKGPLREKPGYDSTLQAFSGIMATTGEPDGGPVRVGVSFIDIATGISAYAGIASALLVRHKTGAGTHVHASLLETAVSCLGFHAVGWLQAKQLPVRAGSGTSNIVPYQAFQCKDGLLVLGAPNEGAWLRLCKAFNDPELAKDERFKDNPSRVKHRDILIPILEQKFLANTREHWSVAMEEAGLAVAPINRVDEVLNHPQVLANDMIVFAEDESGNKQPLIGTPFKLADGGGTATSAPPGQNAHRDTILSHDLGFSDAELAALKNEGLG
ncbi:CaiB/BaiF CoA transferase family protein [Bradyrhizobium sp. ma5]|uniref:CaiB/BaiF CoA transferase family protein n=1 Tax=Bradyrhizobium sp. ma5 TaxID=3344828 RepID=UPI0035D4D9A6